MLHTPGRSIDVQPVRSPKAKAHASAHARPPVSNLLSDFSQTNVVAAASREFVRGAMAEQQGVNLMALTFDQLNQLKGSIEEVRTATIRCALC